MCGLGKWNTFWWRKHSWRIWRCFWRRYGRHVYPWYTSFKTPTTKWVENNRLFMYFISQLFWWTVPEGIEDEAIAAIHFAEGFSQRYGHCHPMFFQGSLDDAMRESVLQPARDVRFLFIVGKLCHLTWFSPKLYRGNYWQCMYITMAPYRATSFAHRSCALNLSYRSWRPTSSSGDGTWLYQAIGYSKDQ